jgi:energy-converting hydrogenase B subunit D
VTVLHVVAVVLCAAAATAVVLTRDLVRLAMLSSLYALTLVVLFLLLQAPDVALSELVVGTIGYPIVLLVAILLDRAE